MKSIRHRASTKSASKIRRNVELPDSRNDFDASRDCCKKPVKRKGYKKSSKHRENTLFQGSADESGELSVGEVLRSKTNYEPKIDEKFNNFEKHDAHQGNQDTHESFNQFWSSPAGISTKENSEISDGSTIDIAESEYGEPEPSLTTDTNSYSSTSRSSSNSPDFSLSDDFIRDDYPDMIFDLKNDAYLDAEDRNLIAVLRNSAVRKRASRSNLDDNENLDRDILIDTDPADRDQPTMEPIHAQSIDDTNRSSFTVIASPISRATPATSPSDSEGPSSEGKESSDSRRSSETTDPDVTAEKSDQSKEEKTALQGLIYKELNDPEVAEKLFHELDGILECAPPNYLESLDPAHDLPLFELLECQDPRPMEHPGKFKYAASSSTGSSSSSTKFNQGGAAASTSSSSQNFKHSGLSPAKRSASPNEGPVIKRQKNGSRSNSSKPGKPFNLRCFHNAWVPEIFRTSHETQDRFRVCAGPGWNTIQHLRDHMQSHHMEKPLLQCSRCQVEFANHDLLKSHEKNVDCPVICPGCDAEFPNKATRLQHQQEIHNNENKESQFFEINDAMDKKIKAKLKAYTESLRKGKTNSDPKLEKWIDDNTERYMMGRDSTAKPRLELGQWYIIFTTLTSSDVLGHPFYDYDTLNPSDLAEERILFINEKLINSKISVRGPPPEDVQKQVGWYQDVLRDSLRVAKRTKWTKFTVQGEAGPSSEHVHDASSNDSVDLPFSYAPMARESSTSGPVYDQQIIGTPHQLTPHDISTYQQMNTGLDSQATATMIRHHSHHSHLTLPRSYLPHDQQTGLVTMSPAAMTPHPASVLDPQLQTSTWHHQSNVGSGMDQTYDSSYDYELQPEFNLGFQQTTSDMLDPSLNPSLDSSLEQPSEYTQTWPLRNQRRR